MAIKQLAMFAAAASAAALPPTVDGGGCVSNVCAPRVVKRVVYPVQQQVVYPQPQLNYQYTYNFVGAPVREQAYAEQMARQVVNLIGETVTKTTESRTEFRTEATQQQGYQQQQQQPPCTCESCAVHGANTPPPPPTGPEEIPFARIESAVSAQCGRCHGDQESPKAGLSLLGDIDAATALASIRKITTQQMPPDRELSNEEAAAVIGELLQLED